MENTKPKGNTSMKTKTEPTRNGGPDLSDRLLTFTSEAIELANSLPTDRAGSMLASALLETVTQSYYAHGEAEGSPSAKDFSDKFRECLKHLRLTRRTLYLVQPLAKGKKEVAKLLEDADILIRIFFSSIRTLESKGI
jgi:hypothetical protein